MNIINQVNGTVNSGLNVVNSNRIASTVLGLFLALYAALAAPNLPASVTKIFKNTWFRLAFMFLIAYMATKDTSVAIITSVALLVTLLTLSAQETTDIVVNAVENKINANIEKFTAVPAPYTSKYDNLEDRNDSQISENEDDDEDEDEDEDSPYDGSYNYDSEPAPVDAIESNLISEVTTQMITENKPSVPMIANIPSNSTESNILPNNNTEQNYEAEDMKETSMMDLISGFENVDSHSNLITNNEFSTEINNINYYEQKETFQNEPDFPSSCGVDASIAVPGFDLGEFADFST